MRKRKFGTTAIRAVMAAAAAAGSLTISAHGALADQAVKIGIGGTSLLNLTYYYLTLPGPLGYWKQEGYDVEVFPVSGSSEAVQQLAAGNLDFAEMQLSSVVIANAEQNVPVRAVLTNGVIGWGLAVRKDGPVKAVGDLKGRNIGIVSLSSGGIPLLKSYVDSAGLDPENDISIIATGAGASALTALQNGQVDALMYWASALVGFKAVDPDLEILRDPNWQKIPDFSLATSQKVVETDPKMLEGIARGVAKAMVFAAANPDCVRQLQWKYYPDSKPTGISEEDAVKRDLSLLAVALDEQKKVQALNPENLVAAVSVEGVGAFQDLLYGTGTLKAKVDPPSVVAGDLAFWKRVNDFDKAAIEAEAKACKIPD